jgi:hypothetical protein
MANLHEKKKRPSFRKIITILPEGMNGEGAPVVRSIQFSSILQR